MAYGENVLAKKCMFYFSAISLFEMLLSPKNI
jgi:hypothetical protein